MAATIDQARDVKRRVGDMARQAGSVAGVGLTRLGDSYAVKVNLEQAASSALPEQIDGVPIVYEVTGVASKRDL